MHYLGMNKYISYIQIVLIIGMNNYLQARPPKTMDEALECVFFVTTYGKDGKPLSSGSAFLVNEGDTQWIISNAHVIEGSTKIVINDNRGNSLKDFGRFSCYSTGSGDVKITSKNETSKNNTASFGGDGIRLEIKEKREISFDIYEDVFIQGSEVITIGDNDGDKVMDILEGEVSSFSKNIILTSCATKPGCSGGVLIDKDSLKVIGLHTWGFSNEITPVDLLWKSESDIDKVAGASVLSNANWVDVSIGDFLKGAEQAKRFEDAVKLLTLMYASTPTESGFTLKYGAEIATGISLQDAYDAFSWNTILRPVASLNQRLSKSEDSNIKINNMEIVSVYADAIKKIREEYIRFSEETKKKIPPYYRNDLENRGVYELGENCYTRIEDAQKWFEEKSSAGGVMPVGRWIDLPPLSSFGGNQ